MQLVDLLVSWESPGGLLEVNLEVLELCIPDASLCCLAISTDEPQVRRVGFASFALLPPSRARAPRLLRGRWSSGSGGGLHAMQEKPEFVPMARPYASHIPIFLYIIMVTVFAVSIV